MAALLSSPALAQDTLKLAVGAPGNWDTRIPEVGQRAGIEAISADAITFKVLAAPLTAEEPATLVQIPPRGN